jgi:hypothetical protein
MSASKKKEDVRGEMRKSFERQTKAYPKLWEAFAKEDPSVLSDDDEPTFEARHVKEEMREEFDRQTIEFADLFEAFA